MSRRAKHSSGQSKQSVQDALKEIMIRATDSPGSDVPVAELRQIIPYTRSVESSAEIMSAVADAIDHKCDSVPAVLKCLKIIYICLISSPEAFHRAASAFVPEIATTLLLTFNGAIDVESDLVRLTVIGICKFLTNRGELPSPASLSLENIVQSIQSAKASEPRREPPKRQAPKQEVSNAVVKPEDDQKPRVPAAFVGGSRSTPIVKPGGDGESLLPTSDGFVESGVQQQEDIFGLFVDSIPERPKNPLLDEGEVQHTGSRLIEIDWDWLRLIEIDWDWLRLIGIDW